MKGVKLFNYACAGAGATRQYDTSVAFTDLADSIGTRFQWWYTYHVDEQIDFFLHMYKERQYKVDKTWLFVVMLGGNDFVYYKANGSNVYKSVLDYVEKLYVKL